MRNIWPNARAFGQMLSAYDQCRTPKFKPAAVDELRNAYGYWRKGSAHAHDIQLGGTGATNCMVKPRSHRACRVDTTTFGLLASNVCIFNIHPAVNYVILSYVIVNDVISTGVVW